MWQVMCITSNMVYLLTHLMSLAAFYTPESFDLIPGYNFDKTCTPPLAFSENSDMKCVKDATTNNRQVHIVGSILT